MVSLALFPTEILIQHLGLLSTVLASDDFRVVKCDNDGLIEMTVLIKPSAVFFAPDGFETVQFEAEDGPVDEEGNPVMIDMYKRIFNRDELTPSFEDDGKELVMSVDISEASKGYKWRDQVIYDHAGHHLNFACTYEMGDRLIKDDFDVKGHNTEISAANSGHLGYTMKVKEESYAIGTTVNFEIVPKNPNLVYASILSCDVFKGEDHQNGATIIGIDADGEEADMCVNPIIKSQLSEYSTMGTLKGSWTSFKWRTDILNKVEDQTLSCKIALTKVKHRL